jgi:exopolyphosphatase
MTSSLCYAYIWTLANPPKICIPLVNIPASDLELRPEFAATLTHGGVGLQQLITLDDLGDASQLSTRLPPDRTSWILVDHNALQGKLGQIYSSRAFGVIDHHKDEQVIPNDTKSEPRIITKAGSCTSLVVEHLKDTWKSLKSSTEPAEGEEDAAQCSAETAKVAIASILIDTFNLKSEDKVTEDDRDAMRFLTSMIPDFDQNSFFEEINTAKHNVGNLHLREILKKDYKEWETSGLRLGVSSSIKSMSFLLDKAASENKDRTPQESFLSIVKSYAKEKELDILGIMTAFSLNGQFTRELFIWALNRDACLAARKFEELSSKELDLGPFQGPNLDTPDDDSEEWRRAWTQAALQHSRKRVAPLIREAMSRL